MTIHLQIRRGLLAFAVLGSCGLLAACGSSSSSSSSSKSSTTASASASTGANGASSASRTALRNCLKAHGVTLPNRPSGNRSPGSGGGVFGGGGGGARPANNPKLAQALQACGASRFRGGGGRFRITHQSINAFVSCVRQHGFNMPDPNFSGKGPVFPASIRSNPKFATASRACASLLRPPASSGGVPPGGPTTAPAESS